MSDVDYRSWLQEREALVSAPTGNLAMVAFQPVGAERAPVEHDVPAEVWRVAGEEGVRISADAEAGITVDGAPVDGEAFVSRLRPDGTPLIRYQHLSIDAFSLDGSDYELRIYDPASEKLDNFDGIDAYDYDPALVLAGHFTAYDETEHVSWDFSRSSDSGHTKKVPGSIEVTVDGTAYQLLAFLDGSVLVLVFADATTGAESYAPGRFLRLDAPGADGSVVVDFNRTFIPPCGFSDYYSCPLPPAQNRIAAPIRAGEKKVRWKVDPYA